MKARKYDRKILQKGIVPNVYAIQESGNITDSIIEFIQKHDETIVNDVIYLKEIFESGKEFGSLIQVKNIDFNNLRTSLNEIIDNSKSTLTDINITNIISNDLMALINQAELLSKKYSAVVTNPPYMNKFEKNLKDFAKKYYKDYSKDLFSMFIYRNFDFCNDYGYNALMTPFVWMFIKNYENLRKFIINNKSISSLIQLEYSAFSEATVPICTFVLSNLNENKTNKLYKRIHIRLSDFKGNMDTQRNKVLKAISNPVDYKYISNSKKYSNIPTSPIAYWANLNVINSFKNKKLIEYAYPKAGISTGNNDKFLRKWFEVEFNNINFNCNSMEETKNVKEKWFPYNKGGKFRKWFGNNELIINWKNNGYEIRNFKRSTIRNPKFHFKKSLTWSTLSSSDISFRYNEQGFLFDSKGANCIIKNEIYFNYLFALLNSKVTMEVLSFLSPTLDFGIGSISNIPIILDNSNLNKINKIVSENIIIQKNNWDNYEISWNYTIHPLLIFGERIIEKSIVKFNKLQKVDFNKLKSNEEYLNKYFIKLYKLTNELDYNISKDSISMNLLSKNDLITSFISFAVGCMFGRYSLDKKGLQFAGGEFNINNYNKFIPDDDNIIPVLDTAYFDDDIVGYFTKFVETCFGKKTLEENLDFIAGALSKSKKTSREIIRQYLLKNFFNDHKRTYKKCPIYWQFSSGKHNGFNCLVYMHRYEPSLVARIRTDYLHKTQKAIEQRIVNNDNIINNSTSKQEVANATKEKAKLQKQLKETQEYDEVLAHIANQNIKIDLDDGVKVNYAKFQNIEIKKEGSKTKKVNLLKKI